MADLGDGDLSLQRHTTTDQDDDGQGEAPGSPRMEFEYSAMGDIAHERSRSPAKRRIPEVPDEEDDIGNAMITPAVEEVHRSEYMQADIQSVVEEPEKQQPETPRHARPRAIRSETRPQVDIAEVQDDSLPHTPPPQPTPSPFSASKRQKSPEDFRIASPSAGGEARASEFSHQQLTQQPEEAEEESDDGDVWQDMPVYAPYDIYDDDGKLVAREHEEEAPPGYGSLTTGNVAGVKGYTKVMVDEDAKSATSMDDNTAFLFDKRNKDAEDDDDIEARDPLAQMNETKNMLTDNQRIAYVGVVRLAIAEMVKDLQKMERTRGAKKAVDYAQESMQLWSQKVMVMLYAHMELDSAEQIMIEQLADHGLQPDDLTPSLMVNARVKNPLAEADASKEEEDKTKQSEEAQASGQASKTQSETDEAEYSKEYTKAAEASQDGAVHDTEEALPAYEEHDGADMPEVRTPSQLPTTENLDIDLRWTVLCDLFLILISDSIYDSRSRTLLERVGSFMDVPWLDICRFEKRVSEALEMQDTELKEDLTEADHMATRKKRVRRKKLLMMGLATVGGGIVIGLSAGLLAPVIGAGLVAGLGTIGVSGGGTFLAGVGGAALIGTTGALSGGTIGGRAAARRMGSVRTFEYRPLYNNRRVNLVITLAGWMTGKVDDVRLPYSTIDPVMGDIVSLLWEPEMLRSMGDTINILATEALTQGLQQILGSTILISLMAALQLPVVLTKLAYLIDNPWSVSMTRADMAGLIMADSLIDRNLGARPITLVGFSLGSRVIFSCLRELARKGAVGLIQNVYVFGSPVVINKDEWLKAQSVVSGRFVNGYANNDWILGYLFRATAGGIMRVAGLAKVDIPGIENVDVTEFVPGHMSYRKAMPRCLRAVGWAIESDDFTEIEDPDPENHQNRQRELINEIEEARKELQKKPEKKRWFWKGKGSKAKKKEWETYEERPAEPVTSATPGSGDYNAEEGQNVLFDVEAIRREAVELAIQGIEIKELKSDQPPLRVVSGSSAGSGARAVSAANPPSHFRNPSITSTHSSPSRSTTHDLRGTRSFDPLPSSQHQPSGSVSAHPSSSSNNYTYHTNATASSRSLDEAPGYAYERHNSHDPDVHEDRAKEEELEAEISMTFEPASPVRSYTMPTHHNTDDIALSGRSSTRTADLSRKLSSQWMEADMAVRPAPHERTSSSPRLAPSSAQNGISHGRNDHDDDGDMGGGGYSSLSYGPGHGGMDHERNVWDDDDDFGREKEMELSFE